MFKKLKWPTLIGILAVHAGLIWAPMTFSWPVFLVFIALNWITIGLGIVLGYHRLLTHRSFKTPKWLEYLLADFGALAAQGGPVKWVATHRVHHAFSDRPQDPHSPTRGFWWAHMGWLFAYDEVLDHPTKHWRYAPELAGDPVHRFIGKTNILQQVALGLLLFAVGGWPFVVWGSFVRIVFGWHCTWAVNSASHLWGYRTYETGERSTNNPWVALLTYGDGWHNNHHAYPTSAAHGLRWWELDLTHLTVRIFAGLGLAEDIHLPRGNPSKLPPARDADPAIIFGACATGQEHIQ
ncbi:MAG: fatty acid desaturase [Candidatus Omnitrophota bacterium]|nr:fatty acid desaturase [Candidatus Omnitrophota bacterium]